MSDTVERCEWPQAYDDLLDYHDDEWGRPTTDQHRLFEKICLEGFQSGLSWLTILRKREAFREAFAGFDFEEDRLLANPGIIRNRRKIEATRLDLGVGGRGAKREETPGGPRMPANTKRSAALATELKSLGWRFFGPTTAYAFMQSEGLTNDHEVHCFVYEACEKERRAILAGRTLRP